MPDAQIHPATLAPAVVANSRDTRIMGVHPQQGHTTNGGAVKIGGAGTVRSTMGAAGARVASNVPAGTPKAQTGAVVAPAQKPAQAGAGKAAVAALKGNVNDLTTAEAALALDIVEGQVTQVVIAGAPPSPMIELAKAVVVKLRAQAGIPATLPLPWDLAPPQVIPAAPVPDPVPVPVPDLTAAVPAAESAGVAAPK